MEPVFFVMAILGCGDASAACTQARVEPVRYRTVQECRAALPAALARNSDLDFPEISASCRASGVRMVRTSAPTPRG
jgi:hypothetical protein